MDILRRFSRCPLVFNCLGLRFCTNASDDDCQFHIVIINNAKAPVRWRVLANLQHRRPRAIFWIIIWSPLPWHICLYIIQANRKPVMYFGECLPLADQTPARQGLLTISVSLNLMWIPKLQNFVFDHDECFCSTLRLSGHVDSLKPFP